MSDMNEKLVFDRPESIIDRPTHYCPGCHHGIAHRLVGELIDEMNLAEKTLMTASIGCSVFIYNYLNVDAVEAPHGRAPAVATGVKRSRPDNFVFTYQGDGDLASIGMAEIMHAANRGEKISVVFINNTVYGMTGGQMAPTTLIGQMTTTTPGGRCQTHEGSPIRMTEIIASLGGVAFAARGSLDSVANIRKAKKYLKKAFEFQVNGTGFGFVELLSGCPTNWKMTPLQANERIQKEMIPYFPLGIFKDVSEEGGIC
ncbi:MULTISPECIES: thiamine pyrophosphate-dependent enzyme [unclassified Pseudodesulfovibrio]|uniref:thiamine pyrophosphate-dependent enzyme n=1 Tax=unclassified Pseudodesulfovibrio TaxID=2661612 RepID=UPI000FEBE1D1|nr:MULTISPECIES: thiamine pyrophosphate-dependent enzyme [unclassified Pseudodesulfovibrio]MCJ2165157.1 thiamine pyrophosphate-dependent enzyme [Pseudodesulfovibrio sp. S3-i]RWU03391.1 2-oxoglutarate oxidoreductase [Pseudodesulfovibrio sp. S3]